MDPINLPENNTNTSEKTFWRKHALGVTVLVLSCFLVSVLGSTVVGVIFLHTNKTISTQTNAASTNTTYVEDSEVIAVVKKTIPSVVSITASRTFANPYGTREEAEAQQVGSGSGFFVSTDGLIVTNKHVVDDDKATYEVVTQDKRRLPAKIVAKDASNDIAIIKVEITDSVALKFGDSKSLSLGQKVIAIGNSLGQYQNTVTTGVVSGIGRSITAGDGFYGASEQLDGVIQTDTAINPGNSGGPLLNLNGEVVGINTAIDGQGQLVGFALPSSDAITALASFQKNGRIARPWLGVRYVIIEKELADQKALPRDYGALIVRGQSTTDFAVIPGSPADKAGLTENNIILSVNGTKVSTDQTLVALMKALSIGDTVTLRVYDKGEEKDIKVILDERK